MRWKKTHRAIVSLTILTAIWLQGCGEKSNNQQASLPLDEPVIVEHSLGRTVITQRPRQVAVLDMNEADFLDQLGVPIAGMVKDYVPHFLARYKSAPDVQDLGAITQPNMEKVYALNPDLILITPIQANHYEELSGLAPTVHFDVDFRDSRNGHITAVKEHLRSLGRIFDKSDLAGQKIDEIDAKVAQARQVTNGRPETALIVMHNNGTFSSFGVRSRYGFIFDALGVKPASNIDASSLHGQPVSSEFIHQADPDILYVIDRTAVMERRPVMTAEQMGNPLLRQTKAWKNGRVVFVDADAWYITAASVTSLKILIDEVIAGYQG